MYEIFLDIPGYEGLYQVSNQGRVKSLITNRILKPAKSSNGHFEKLHKSVSKKVVCIETGQVFDSTQAAADFVNIKDRSLISRCCKGTRKTTGGYHWKYYNSSTPQVIGTNVLGRPPYFQM